MKNGKILSKFGRDYLLLGLRIGKLIDDYIDAYYGPQELKEIIDGEAKKSPNNLMVACKSLQKEVSFILLGVKNKSQIYAFLKYHRVKNNKITA